MTLDFVTLFALLVPAASAPMAFVLFLLDPMGREARERWLARFRRVRALVSARLAVAKKEQQKRDFHKNCKIDPCAKCPSCGHFNGTIRFDRGLRKVVHTCAVCDCEWGEATVVNVDEFCPKLQPVQVMPEQRAKEREARSLRELLAQAS